MIPRGCLIIAFVAVLALTTTAAEPATTSLRVLCYNIHHGEGTDGRIALPRLAKVITDAKPDLVALQEVDFQTRRTRTVDQTAELARLTGLNGQFAKAIDYEGGEYGQAILSRFPLDKLAIHWLPGEPDRERRIAAEARLKIDGREFTFITTHLHHASRDFREQQARKLNELFAAGDRTVILAGDLNATPNEKPIQILGEKWQNATAGESLFSYPAPKPAKQLDYILIRPANRLRVVEAKVIPEAIASDHRPVLAVLEWVK